VRTESQSEKPGEGVRFFFARSGSAKLVACAQARYGAAASAEVFAPFGVSICEWVERNALPQRIVEYKSKDGTKPCPGVDLSGQSFAWNGITGWAFLDLLSASLPAEARSTVKCPNPATDKPALLRIGYQLSLITKSQNSSTYCGDSDLAPKLRNWVDKTLFIPLVSNPKLSGNSTVFTVEAFASFKLTGFALMRGSGGSSEFGGVIPSGQSCPSSDKCIWGQFLSTFIPSLDLSDGSGTPNVGLQAIELF